MSDENKNNSNEQEIEENASEEKDEKSKKSSIGDKLPNSNDGSLADESVQDYKDMKNAAATVKGFSDKVPTKNKDDAGESETTEETAERSSEAVDSSSDDGEQSENQGNEPESAGNEEKRLRDIQDNASPEPFDNEPGDGSNEGSDDQDPTQGQDGQNSSPESQSRQMKDGSDVPASELGGTASNADENGQQSGGSDPESGASATDGDNSNTSAGQDGGAQSDAGSGATESGAEPGAAQGAAGTSDASSNEANGSSASTDQTDASGASSKGNDQGGVVIVDGDEQKDASSEQGDTSEGSESDTSDSAPENSSDRSSNSLASRTKKDRDALYKKYGTQNDKKRNSGRSTTSTREGSSTRKTGNQARGRTGSAAKNANASARQGAMNISQQSAQRAASMSRAAESMSSRGPFSAALKLAKATPVGRTVLSVVLIACLIFVSLFTVVFTYALPTSIFETAQTYVEEFEAEAYASDGEIHWAKFVAGIKVAGSMVGDALSEIGDKIMSWLTGDDNSANKDNDGKDIESSSSDAQELRVTQQEEAEKATLTDKIEATQKKVNTRTEDVCDAVRGTEDEIEKLVEEYYNSDGKYDDFDVNVNVTRYKLSKEGAVAIMGLYMVQEGGSLDDVKLSSLMKWLGYYDGFQSERLEFNVLGADCEVKTWQGTFLPQYLHEQKDQEEDMYKKAKTEFADYQTGAADLMIVADVPEMDELSVFESEVTDEDGNTQTVGRVTVNVKVQPRELEDIADLMGMWIGDLSKRQEYMPSNLSVNMIDTGASGSYGTGSYEWLEGGELIGYTPHHDLYSAFIGWPGQCTWYAADRLYQLYVETNGEYGIDLTQYGAMGHGGQWAARAAALGYKVDSVAEAGKAACFVPGVTQNHPGDAWQPFDAQCGHIAIVEKVNPDGSIVVSEMWGHNVDYDVKFSYFTKETAATILYIDFTEKS